MYSLGEYASQQVYRRNARCNRVLSWIIRKSRQCRACHVGSTSYSYSCEGHRIHNGYRNLVHLLCSGRVHSSAHTGHVLLQLLRAKTYDLAIYKSFILTFSHADVQRIEVKPINIQIIALCQRGQQARADAF